MTLNIFFLVAFLFAAVYSRPVRDELSALYARRTEMDPRLTFPSPLPLGTLVYPTQYQSIENIDGLGWMYFEYEGVNMIGVDGGPVQTVSVDFWLYDPNTGQSTQWVMSLRGPTAGTTITAILTPPPGACGQFQLIVTDVLDYEGQLTFTAPASPYIEIVCE